MQNLKTRVYVAAAAVAATGLTVYSLAAPFGSSN